MMKTLAMPVDMVCWFEKTGIPHPVRFKVAKEDESETVIKLYYEKNGFFSNCKELADLLLLNK